jgi:hypothetical protein
LMVKGVEDFVVLKYKLVEETTWVREKQKIM